MNDPTRKPTRLKYWIGILVVSLSVLAVDMATRGPADAAASTDAQDTSQQAAAPASTPSPATSSDAPAPRRAMAHLLDRFSSAVPADVAAIDDAFVPSPDWIPPASVQSVATSAEQGALTPAQQFAAAHALSGVMSLGDGGFAIVNQQIIRKGAAISGFTLIEVSSDSAVFKSGDIAVRLTVPVTSR